MMSLYESNIFKLVVKQCTTRVLFIYVASPATSSANSATLIYVTNIASRRRAGIAGNTSIAGKMESAPNVTTRFIVTKKKFTYAMKLKKLDK